MNTSGARGFDEPVSDEVLFGVVGPTSETEEATLGCAPHAQAGHELPPLLPTNDVLVGVDLAEPRENTSSDVVESFDINLMDDLPSPPPIGSLDVPQTIFDDKEERDDSLFDPEQGHLTENVEEDAPLNSFDKTVAPDNIFSDAPLLLTSEVETTIAEAVNEAAMPTSNLFVATSDATSPAASEVVVAPLFVKVVPLAKTAGHFISEEETISVSLDDKIPTLDNLEPPRTVHYCDRLCDLIIT